MRCKGTTMFSYELEKYISERNNQLTYQEFLFISDINLHPQISNIKYLGNNAIQIHTSNGYNFVVHICA